MFLIEFAILIYSVILHEVAHGYIAEKLGDPTARVRGRLTLNPIPHIDPLMTIALPLLLLISGAGIIFGAAKPVPIDPFNFREPKKDTALTALAGPMTNFVIAVVLAIVLRVLFMFVVNDVVYSIIHGVLLSGIMWNVGLALFNLIPIPPLDGFKVLAGVLPDNVAADMYQLERYGFIVIIFILFLFPNVIFGIIGPVMRTITGVLVP